MSNKKNIILASGPFNLRVQTWGDEQQPAILAIHGWLDNSSTFESLAEAAPNYYWIAPDLVGHGHSPHLPMNLLYMLETQVLVLLTLLDELSLKQFIVLGHSLGAGIGVGITAALPEQVSHLIMLDKLGPPTLAETDYLDQFIKNMNSRIRRDRIMAEYPTIEEAIEIRQLMSGCSEKAARLIAERDLMATTTGYRSRTDFRLQFKSHRSMTQSQAQSLFKVISCPSLLIRAESGMLTDCDLSEDIACFSKLKVDYVPGNHHVHIDNPSLIASRINAFLGHYND